MGHYVFISHSSQDSKWAIEICTLIESHGVKCWVAPRDIRPGAAYPSEITRSIKECSIFLIILTKESVHSSHVNTETDIAFNNDKQIIPFFIDKVALGDSMSYYLARKQWILGYENFTHAKETLLQCILGKANVKNAASSLKEPSDMSYSCDNETLREEALNHSEKRDSLKGNTKKQLYFLVILLLLLIPLMGFVLAVLLWLYPQKVQTLFRNHKNHIVIASSLILGLIIIWCGFLWYDDYTYKKGDSTEQIFSNTTDIESVEEVKAEATSPMIDCEVPMNNIQTGQELPVPEIATTTFINDKQCSASWNVENKYNSVTFIGHIVPHIDNINDLNCILRLHKRSLSGIIEDKDGADIGYFEGKLTEISSGYRIIGELVVEGENYSYSHLTCIVEIKNSSSLKDMLDKEINQTYD